MRCTAHNARVQVHRVDDLHTLAPYRVARSRSEADLSCRDQLLAVGGHEEQPSPFRDQRVQVVRRPAALPVERIDHGVARDDDGAAVEPFPERFVVRRRSARVRVRGCRETPVDLLGKG
jgi:hypothetical protein